MSEDKLFPHAEAERAGYYAATGWSIEDVKSHYPQLTDQQAEDYLNQHEDDIRDAMIRAGHDAINCFEPEVEEGEV